MEEKQTQILIDRFLKNMSFLKGQDLELYLEIEALSQLINSGEYKERYILEYIEEENEYDIYDELEKRYLYDKQAKKINKTLADKIQLDDKNLILPFEDTLLKEYEQVEDIKILRENAEDNKAELLIQVLNKYTKILGEQENISPLKIEKFVFFGTLLGGHIEDIVKKLNSYTYLVFEKNLEIFRLSLFIVDYSILVKRRGKVIFSISKDNIKEDIQSFLTLDFVNNSMIKFSSTYIDTKKYQEEFLSYIISSRATIYDFNRILYTSLKNSSIKWKNNYPKLLYKKLQKDFDGFDDFPLLYIASGPSLEDNLSWIKKNQNKFIIASIGSSYEKLLKNNIKVDMIFTLDGMYKVLDKSQFSNENVSNLSDEIIFSSIITDERIVKKLDKNTVFFYETYFCFHKDNFPIFVSSIGEMGLALLLLMGVKDIYLLGLDMALNQDTGLSHAKDVNSGVKKYNLEDEKLADNSSVNLDVLLEVKGNIKKSVFTNLRYKKSLDYINLIINNFAKNSKIYNLSNHGVYFDNTTPMKIETLAISKFKKLNFDKELFRKKLLQSSSRNLQENMKKSIEDEITFLEKILKDDLEIFKKDKSKKIEVFIIKNSKFFSKLMQNNSFIHSFIFSNYFNIVLNYLTLKFNNTLLKNQREKLKQVRLIMYEDIKILIIDTIKYLRDMT